MNLSIRKNVWNDQVECVLPLPANGVNRLIAAAEDRKIKGFTYGDTCAGVFAQIHADLNGQSVTYVAVAETDELVVIIERRWIEEFNYTNDDLAADKQWADFIAPVRQLLAAMN